MFKEVQQFKKTQCTSHIVEEEDTDVDDHPLLLDKAEKLYSGSEWEEQDELGNITAHKGGPTNSETKKVLTSDEVK
ncbi:MAG: hypothetical protein M1830_001286 [Pleopsidium flavum]|nr:MAG: hypothetical protein M1830_001286 [Pleopsidium flavum]